MVSSEKTEHRTFYTIFFEESETEDLAFFGFDVPNGATKKFDEPDIENYMGVIPFQGIVCRPRVLHISRPSRILCKLHK